MTVRDNGARTGIPARAFSEPVIAYWGDLVTAVGQYPFAGGDGSEADPYLIATAEQLAQLAYDTAQDIDYYGNISNKRPTLISGRSSGTQSAHRLAANSEHASTGTIRL